MDGVSSASKSSSPPSPCPNSIILHPSPRLYFSCLFQYNSSHLVSPSSPHGFVWLTPPLPMPPSFHLFPPYIVHSLSLSLYSFGLQSLHKETQFPLPQLFVWSIFSVLPPHPQLFPSSTFLWSQYFSHGQSAPNSILSFPISVSFSSWPFQFLHIPCLVYSFIFPWLYLK